MTDGPGTGERLRVAVFVGTRADLGPLSPVLDRLRRADDVDLSVLTGLAFTPETLAAAMGDEPGHQVWRAATHALAEPIRDTATPSILAQGTSMSTGAARLLQELDTQVLVVLGDRWELLYVVPPAYLLGIPIVHLHGGEVTEGALDERVRHAVTKLADQHCVASQDAAARLLRMGEPPDRVHHTGAPGLDRLASAAPLTDEELGSLLGTDVQRPVALFTYHPPTATGSAPVGRWAREALEATRRSCRTVVATYPGVDTGREEIIEALTEVSAHDSRVVVHEALGAAYPRVLASVDLVVGNSSSGIIEAASARVPSVNIGDRQRGRLRPASVFDADEGLAGVAAAVERALLPESRALAARTVNPYGTGDASSRILDIVRAAPRAPRAKPFTNSEVTSQ